MLGKCVKLTLHECGFYTRSAAHDIPHKLLRSHECNKVFFKSGLVKIYALLLRIWQLFPFEYF
jgi:hypothetical protein